MSSDTPPPRRVADLAAELGRGARGFYDRVTSSSDAPGLYVAADRRATDAADLAVDLGEIVLGAAVAIGEQVLDVARQLESRLGERGGRPPGPQVEAGSPAAVLVLPTVSPGRSASAPFTVRNDSLETIDAMPLRCDGLFGAGGTRITGRRVSFRPSTVAVAPGGTADVQCVVDVLDTTKRGGYTGLIEAAGLPGVRLLVTLDVI
jgi:hypothetical protein